jgi:hypothetical protein
MKRRESVLPKVDASLEEKVDLNDDFIPEADEDRKGERILLMDDGKLIPFSTEDYTRSALYQVVESFSVECRLVRPEDPGNIIFEGKKPSRKTVPVIVNRGGESVLLDSWESLESAPEQLAEATEVIGVATVRQVFVLKRK